MAELVVEILDFWHAGSSRGGGVAADATCLKDRDGLPYLPGRHLKGLIREAVTRCPLVEKRVPGELREEVVEELFGGAGFVRMPNRAPEIVERTRAGALAFGNAVLPEPLRLKLRGGDKHLVPFLFTGLSQTAVDHGRGAALGGTLRRTEVAVPLTLHATIECLDDQVGRKPWQAMIADALPLVMAVGRKRSRGLGRCRMQLAGFLPGAAASGG